MPRPGADALESYVRLFNYPGRSEIRSFEDRKKYGFRTCFFSNSYAAYRVRALKEAGGFPSGLILGEDVGASANMLLDGWKLAYVADACVFHSHGYTAGAYFRRSFDIGVQHTQMRDKIRQFGGPEGMGVRYVLAETAISAESCALCAFPKRWAATFCAISAIGWGGYTNRCRSPWCASSACTKASGPIASGKPPALETSGRLAACQARRRLRYSR